MLHGQGNLDHIAARYHLLDDNGKVPFPLQAKGHLFQCGVPFPFLHTERIKIGGEICYLPSLHRQKSVGLKTIRAFDVESLLFFFCCMGQGI